MEPGLSPEYLAEHPTAEFIDGAPKRRAPLGTCDRYISRKDRFAFADLIQLTSKDGIERSYIRCKNHEGLEYSSSAEDTTPHSSPLECPVDFPIMRVQFHTHAARPRWTYLLRSVPQRLLTSEDARSANRLRSTYQRGAYCIGYTNPFARRGGTIKVRSRKPKYSRAMRQGYSSAEGIIRETRCIEIAGLNDEEVMRYDAEIKPLESETDVDVRYLSRSALDIGTIERLKQAQSEKETRENRFSNRMGSCEIVV